MAKLLQVSFLILSLAVPITVARRARATQGLALTVGLFLGIVLVYVVLVGWVVPRLA